ncbi:Vegetative incompatibility protein HET-E-1 [Lachnellula willkommii]|uniref:Vegetative incompatibility protein HET-E-1 n=1 Tax=Lachnellula willkommii TaxID=215461 RepID=A0A559ML45_9HELO|nr:Vegetative incompatibility protein HET-E-1 [Lachnellula willkommii]
MNGAPQMNSRSKASKYRKWALSKSSNLLWLTGCSGVGKTVISSFIGQQLSKETTNRVEPILVVLSYFCNLNTDVKDLLRHLLWHYLEQRPELFFVVEEQFDRKDRRLYGKNDRIQGLLDMLQLLGGHVPTYIIIDGLDECAEKCAEKADVQMLIQKIVDLTGQGEVSTVPFKILLSFSDETSFRFASQKIPDAQRLDMYQEMKNLDFENLRLFAKNQVHELASEGIILFSQTDEVIQNLVRRAEGLFVWLSLTCFNMRNRERGFDPTQTALLPDGMGALIHKMILQIHPEDRPQAARVLRCLSAARRALTFNEIGDALAVDVEKTRRFVKCCGSLLYTYESNKVKLYHNSVREFLGGEKVRNDQRISLFGLGNMHEDISEVCFGILSRQLQSHLEVGEKRSIVARSVRPLTDYATQYWPIHARLAKLQASFFKNYHDETLFRELWRANWECTGLGYRIIPKSTSLHVGAAFGLVGLLQYYAKSMSRNAFQLRQHLRKRDSTGHTLLAWAAEFGHEDVMKYLINEEKLDPNGLQGPFGTTLQTAAAWGQVRIVEWLLNHRSKDRRLNLDTKKGKFGTALQAAAITDNPMIVRLLLDDDADANINGSGWFGNALQAGAANGSFEVVRILLDAEADPNAQGGWYGNALRAASTNGHVEIVRLLLDGKAKVDHNERLQDIISRIVSLRKIMNSKTQLKASTRLGQARSTISIVKSEASRIKADMATRYTKTISTQEAFLFALHHVLFRSKLLSSENSSNLSSLTDEERHQFTDQGFEIYLRGLFYGNALQAAAAEGHTEVVALLIANHADVNANTGIFGTALQAAVAENKGEVVDLLLSLDNVDLYQTGGAYGSAMSAALREGRTDLKQKLRAAGIKKQRNAKKEVEQMAAPDKI